MEIINVKNVEVPALNIMSVHAGERQYCGKITQ